MTVATGGVLRALFCILIASLWLAVAVMAILWLGMVAGFFCSAARLCFPKRHPARHPPAADVEFLRRMHIRP